MIDQYDRLYTQIEGLIPDFRNLEPGNYRKSVSPGFMDLHLDILKKTEDEMVIALSHTYKQKGDLVPDPDMEIRIYLIDEWKKAEALTYRDMYRYDRVYPDPNHVRPRLKRSLNAFLKRWLTNLKNQGHTLSPN